MLLPSTSRLSSRLLQRIAAHASILPKQRAFQSTAVVSEPPSPLFLWLGAEASCERRKLLLPVVRNIITVQTSSDIVELVNEHYENEKYFVGGMGEGDPGVWFAAVGDKNEDTLDYAPLIQESIQLVKQERHGVPFGLYTTGVVQDLKVPLSEIGVDSIQVSLFASSPTEYKEATGSDAFGQVCGFIADASEQGVSVEVGVLKKYASSARELATSLGARHVHVYEE